MKKKQLVKQYNKEEKRHDEAYKKENARHEKRHVVELREAFNACKEGKKPKKRKNRKSV